MSASCWTLLVLVVSVCIYGVRLHAQDRRDWIPPRNNVEAYFPPPRSVKKNKSLLAAFAKDPGAPAEERLVSPSEPSTTSPYESGEDVLGTMKSELFCLLFLATLGAGGC